MPYVNVLQGGVLYNVKSGSIINRGVTKYCATKYCDIKT